MTFQVHCNKSSFAGSKEEDFEGRLGVVESGVVYWVFVSTVKLYIGFASYFVKKNTLLMAISSTLMHTVVN